jgi:hypothetical protein
MMAIHPEMLQKVRDEQMALRKDVNEPLNYEIME